MWAGGSTLIAALLVGALHTNRSKRISIFGAHPLKHTLVLALPTIAFALVGLDNDLGWSPHGYGFAFAAVNTVYAFTEELGWRRYLQNALEAWSPTLKYLFIGAIWWIWHFRFETSFDWFIFPLICLGGGFLLGKLADDTQSMLPVTAMHTLVILTTNAGQFGPRELLGIALVILGWMGIERWFKSSPPAAPETDSPTSLH